MSKTPRRYGAKHGTEYSYRFHACRCELCKAVHSNRLKILKARRVGKEPPVHGTRSSYLNWGCRCNACHEADLIAQKAYREARKAREE